MLGHRTLHRHAAMMNRMAEVQGLDLMAEMAAGALSGEDWRAAVVRCTGCGDAEECLAWLGVHQPPENGAAAQVPPAFCVNRELLVHLQASGEEGA
ncbi:DUF6455 family protein [Paenirhodobacter sp.]|uniref:DUF6455 family protein n=1 Tax=Paenirhodobacter sp. TaxID=1965326 RepID=UPI003B3CB673